MTKNVGNPPRRALEDNHRLRCRRMGAFVRFGLRRGEDHCRADHENEHQSVLRENEGRRGGESQRSSGSTFAASPANTMATTRARWTRSSIL